MDADRAKRDTFPNLFAKKRVERHNKKRKRAAAQQQCSLGCGERGKPRARRIRFLAERHVELSWPPE